ncbi:L-serine dehydratase/L-threonine deaminase-like [Ruditapes philippinarum]|uniref:L-serine dehydratase/L-threonine deaminase-like n=1 Tax=Ruditapes philippinarum TaxID=129788 RepID=UPI00295A592A|nr:L-serine dehydratase/L-threonine deaminase-like [Ruditapes philippinarum]
MASGEGPLHIVTPTIYSMPLSKLTGYDVYLKLENLQIPGSFKIRGIGNLIKKASQHGCKKIVCSSGANVVLAAAYAAKTLGIPATIVLPQSTPGFVIDKLRNEYGAEVLLHGKVLDDSHNFAAEMAKDSDCLFVHPYDHPDIWEGHSSMIEEAAQQMPCKPDVIIVSVGGGGLLNGVMMGMKKVGWSDVTCIAMETIGADCLNVSLKAGKIVTLPDITSIACLGALSPSAKTFELAQSYEKFHSAVVEDKEAVSACVRFADDHKMLVEPACGASLAAMYETIIQDLQSSGKLGDVKSALVIVCGAGSATLEQLQAWRDMFNL